MCPCEEQRWKEVQTSKLIGFLVGVTVFGLVLLKSEPGFVTILDHANLLFHEAGHPFFGLFSSRLCVYGGTLGQLTFPVVLAISFWRKREPIPFAVSIIWFFENWPNIARYMADARVQLLPLVGGGDHDWAEIFGRWQLLNYDTRIAEVVRICGWLGMIAPCIWVVRLWWSSRLNACQVAGEAATKSQAGLL
jgi:hypothetical protein